MSTDYVESLEVPDAVDVLVAEYLDACDHGHTPSRSDWLSRYPEQAVELARFLDALENLSPAKTARPTDTATNGETQLLPGGNAPKDAAARGSETVLWNTSSGSTDAASTSAEAVPFNGSFGDYDLLETVARGGMGVVFKARHRQLDRVVALKMILTGQLADAQHIQRFRAEAQAAAKLDHPGIVPVYEVGEEKGLHYFTMAFVEGKSLAARLLDGPLPAKEAARLVRDLAAAVAYAHEHGIVHRDLKPANVLIDAQGQPKLTDFGLAKQTHGASEMTGTGQILGTPSYMSPEQAQGDAATVGPAADVYGLGALLFALLTGRPPFQGASPFETIQHVIVAEAPKPRVLNPSVPRDLETICLKCLEKSPSKRYAAANALKDDLDRFLEDRPILARPAGVIEKAWRWYRRRPLVGTMAAALALLLIAVPLLLAGFWQEAEARADVEAGAHKQEAAAHKKEKEAREREEEARKKIEKLERERSVQLFQAYVNEAAARRTSPRVGRRFNALDRIVAARDLAKELKLPAAEYERVRSEAISALSLVDVRQTSTGPGWAYEEDDRNGQYFFRYVTAGDSYLAWDKPGGLLVRRVGDNRVLQRIKVEPTDWCVNAVRLSRDNRFVSSHLRNRNKLVVWQVDGDTPKELLKLETVRAAMFSPDRPEIVIYTMAGDLVVHPLTGKEKPKTFRIPELAKEPAPIDWPWECEPGPNRQVAVAGFKRIHVIDLEASKVVATFAIPGRVSDLRWSHDGATLAVGSWNDNAIVLYDAASKTQRSINNFLPGGPVTIGFDPSGRCLLAMNAWTWRNVLVNVATGTQELRFFGGEPATKEAPAAVGAWFQVPSAVPYHLVTFPAEMGLATPAMSAIHPTGRLLASTTGKGIVLSDVATGRHVGLLPSDGYSHSACFDADGNLFAVRSQRQGDPMKPTRWPISVQGNRYAIGAGQALALPVTNDIDVSRDGRIVAVTQFTHALALDRQTGKTVKLAPQQDARRVAVSPDGSLVATFSWGIAGFRVWEAKTGKLVYVDGFGTQGNGRFTADGKYLLTAGFGDGSGLRLWSVPDLKFVRRLDGIGVAFALSPDGHCLAVAEGSGKVRLTRIADGETIARFDAPGNDSVVDINFSPDGRYLVGLNLERTSYHVWDLGLLRRQLADLKLDWTGQAPPKADPVRGSIVAEIAPQN